MSWPVKLTAVLEAGIAAVFEHLKNKIIIEIDEPELGTDWRELLIAAWKEMEGEDISVEENPLMNVGVVGLQEPRISVTQARTHSALRYCTCKL